jgi:hypothetical protein
MDLEAFDRIARRQHSLVTSAQLHALGLTKSDVHHRANAGLLVPVRRGVWRTAGSLVTQDQAWMAAALAAGDDHLVSHGTAAAAWVLGGFPPPDRIDVLTDGWRTSIEGVRAHVTTSLPDRDRTTLRRIPITTVARTYVDACGLLHPRTLGRSVDDAVRRKILTLHDLVRCAATVPLSGRRTSRPIREVLADRVDGYHPGGSAEELDVLVVLRRLGLPLPVQQYRLRIKGRTYFLDYAWPETRHYLEYLGATWHGTASALHDDSERTRRIQRAGWTGWPLTRYLNEPELAAIAELATEGLRAA